MASLLSVTGSMCSYHVLREKRRLCGLGSILISPPLPYPTFYFCCFVVMLSTLVNSLKSFLNILNTLKPHDIGFSDPKLFHHISQEEEIMLLIVSQEGWHFWIE